MSILLKNAVITITSFTILVSCSRLPITSEGRLDLTLTPNTTLIPHPYVTKTPIPSPDFSIAVGGVTYVPTIEPGLGPAETLTKINELLRLHNDCKLPCWWGITPGLTNWNEVSLIYSELADYIVYDDKEYLDSIDIGLSISMNENDPIRQQFFIENNLITGIIADPGSIGQIALDEFYSIYGIPNEIRVGTWYPAREGDAIRGEAPIYLAYLDRGIIAMFLLKTLVGVERVDLCLSDAELGQLVLWEFSEYHPFSDLELLTHSRVQTPLEKNYPLLADVSDIQDQEFWDMVSLGDGKECISTSREVWIGTD